MKKLILVIIACINVPLVLAQTTLTNKLSDEHIEITGTKISMIPPQNFTSAINFSGFQQNESGASIMVLDIPGPFSEVSKSFTKEGLLSQGMIFVASEEFTLNDFPARLLSVQQEAYGQTFSKHILAFGNDKKTVLINGTYPKERKELDSPIRKALLTIYYDSNKKINPFDTVDFEINVEDSELTFAKGMANSLIFNRDGKIPSQSEDQANFIVGKAFSEVIVGDKEQFARTRVKQLPVEIDSIVSSAPIIIDGLSGIEIIADGKNPRSGDQEKVYQTILFDDTLYYIILGSCKSKFENNIKIFKKIAQTFKRKK